MNDDGAGTARLDLNRLVALAQPEWRLLLVAAEAANAHVTELPDGYATEAGERGVQLSGGSGSAWSKGSRTGRWSRRP